MATTNINCPGNFTCPYCHQTLTIPIATTTKPGPGQRGQRGATLDINADITDEARQIIADHAKAAHSG